MPRRNAQAVDTDVKKERWNKWRIMLRRQEFQTSLFQLRGLYRQWVNGPPIHHYACDYDDPVFDDEGHEYPREILCEIERKDADLDKQNLDRLEPMVEAWAGFNLKWGIRLPKIALTEELPDLSPFTVAEWEWVGDVSGRVIPPPITNVRQDGPQRHCLTLTVDLGHPRHILLAKINEEIANAVRDLPKDQRQGSLPAKRKRRRHDKLTFQFEVYDRYMRGEQPWQIARALRKPLGTVKSALATAVKVIRGARPLVGKAWEKKHLSACQRCRNAKELDLMCPTAAEYLDKLVDAAEHRYRNSTYLPPLPVQSEKSAFAKWDAKHPPRRDY